jgi:PPP family 3-phenylpropionic acid transporter
MHAVPYARLAAFYVAYFGFVGAFGPYFSLYLQSIGQTALEIGVLLSLMQFMRIFAPYLWAGVADRSGRRAFLLRIALLASVASYCGVFVTQSFWGLFVTLALLAFCNSAANPLFETLVFSYLRDDLGRYGVLRVWGSVGFIGAVLSVGAVLDAQPVDTLLVLVLPTLAASFLIAIGLDDSPSDARQGAGKPVWPLLRRPEVAALLAACFLMSVAHGPLYTFYSIYLADHGYTKTTVGVLWSLGVVAEIGVFLLAPTIFARWSPNAVLIFSFACAVARFAAIGWGVGSLPVLIGAQLLHAASFGSYHAAALGQVNRWFPGGQRSRGQALYLSLSFGAGGMVGGLGSGLAWDSIGPAWTFTAASVCAALGLILVAATATMTRGATRLA